MENESNSTNSFQTRLFVKGKASRAETTKEFCYSLAKRNQLDQLKR